MISKIAQFGEVAIMYGQKHLVAVVMLVGGLLAAKMFIRLIRYILRRFTLNERLVSVVSNVLNVVFLLYLVALVLEQVGMHTDFVASILATISLAAIGLIVVFRPYIPSLPFKAGNTVKAGGLLGTVEATTLLNTRLRTFDGKTVFVPNRKILSENVINYHFDPTRQIRLIIPIGYEDDLLKAKKVISEILAEDPRVLEDPPAWVFVINLGENAVELGARPWVKNLDYRRTRCDLLEKIKLRLDQEGITIPLPQLVIHTYQEPDYVGSPVE